MLFSDRPRAHYPNAPVHEVICQLRFPTILSINNVEPADFQEVIRDTFPQYVRRQDMPAPLPGPNAPKPAPVSNYHFISADNLWKLNLTKNFIALSTVSYPGWEQFAGQFDLPLAEFIRIYQPAFFERIGLRALLREYTGVIMGVSAGSMNCRDVVYAQPELPGESIDPAYRRFIPGLNLSRVQILPHYQMVKDNILDGKRLFEDITFGDSFGRTFYALVDGSYVMRIDDEYTLWGEGYRIRDGRIEHICRDGEHITIGEH